MRSKNRTKIICATLTLVAGLSTTFAFAKDGERTITLQEDVSQAELLRLDVSAGDVEVTGIAGNNLTAVVSASCQKENQDKCNQVLKELSWSKKTGSTTEFALTPSSLNRYDHITITVKVGVPKDKKLDVNLSAGELRIEGTNACLTAEVGAGELQIKLKPNQLASADLSAKVGDARLITPTGEAIEGERSLLVGASLKWSKGTGSCHTKASVLAGEARLLLN